MPIVILCHPQLNVSARLLWGYLKDKQGMNKTAWPKQETMAEDLHVSVKTVKRDIQALVKEGLLVVIPPEKKGPGHFNQYIVKDPPKAKKKGSKRIESRGQICQEKGSDLPSNNTQGTITIEQEKSDFIPPSPREVEEYAQSIGFTLDGDYFCEYYGAADWHQKGGKPMKNWKQAVVTWKHRQQTKSEPTKAYKPGCVGPEDDSFDPSPEEVKRILGVAS